LLGHELLPMGVEVMQPTACRHLPTS
jgi:hypothetical protein